MTTSNSKYNFIHKMFTKKVYLNTCNTKDGTANSRFCEVKRGL